MKGAAEAAP